MNVHTVSCTVHGIHDQIIIIIMIRVNNYTHTHTHSKYPVLCHSFVNYINLDFVVKPYEPHVTCTTSINKRIVKMHVHHVVRCTVPVLISGVRVSDSGVILYRIATIVTVLISVVSRIEGLTISLYLVYSPPAGTCFVYMYQTIAVTVS